METVELSQQQSASTAELPEDYRMGVGIDRKTPLARKPLDRSFVSRRTAAGPRPRSRPGCRWPQSPVSD
jgi:hypothetical protein